MVNRKSKLNNWISFMISLMLVSSLYEVTAQVVSDERIPHVYPNAGAGDLYLDRNSRLHIMGMADSVTAYIFEETYGLHTLYYTLRDSTSFSVATSVPGATPYHYAFFQATRFLFNYDIAADNNNNIFTVWSKQQEYATDVPPLYWRRPVLMCYKRVGNSWQSIFQEPSGRNPRCAPGSDNSLHFVWESVSTNRPDTNFFFYSSKVTYRARSSSGVLSSPLVIDSGFVPKIIVDGSNNVHILYLQADSINSSFFRLKSVRSTVGGFTTPVLLFGRIPAENNYPYSRILTNVSFFVDQGGKVHAAWSEPRTYPNIKLFSLTYDGSSIVVDSSQAYNSFNVAFACEADGTVHAAWSVVVGGGSDDLLYSSTRGGPLFSSIRTLRSMVYVARLTMHVNSRGLVNAVFIDATGINLLKDLANGPDTLVTLVPGNTVYNAASRSVVVDASDRIWISCLRRRSDTTYTYEPWLVQYLERPLNVFQSPELPITFNLGQNYPNPFNPSTTIRYQLGQRSSVSLKVFDVLGREVATLVDEVQGAGFKNVEFDAGNLSSGVYYYQLRGNGNLQTKSMLLMK